MDLLCTAGSNPLPLLGQIEDRFRLLTHRRVTPPPKTGQGQLYDSQTIKPPINSIFINFSSDA